MIPTTPFLKLVTAGAALALATTARSETFNQTIFDAQTSIWTMSNVWGGNAVTAGNDYQMVANPTRVAENNPYEANTFIIDVGGTTTTWNTFAWVRDHPQSSPPTVNTTFEGNHLLIASGTRFLSKARNTTSTANFVLQDGGFMQLSPANSGGGGPGTGTWAGTISTSGNTLIGLESSASTDVTTLNVTAPISGSGLLTLTGKGANSGFLNLNGDISGFTGTFLLSSATAKSVTPLIFSIASSAELATLQLNWESPMFFYDLGENEVTFASLILGADNALGLGTYDAAALNSLTGNAGIFSGTGSITVVPEPGTIALCAMAALAMGVLRRRRRVA